MFNDYDWYKAEHCIYGIGSVGIALIVIPYESKIQYSTICCYLNDWLQLALAVDDQLLELVSAAGEQPTSAAVTARALPDGSRMPLVTGVSVRWPGGCARSEPRWLL
eukprot:6212655-Pleurochrysis_carterae.AAC.1